VGSGEPHCCLWVVLGPCHHLHTCCCCLAVCHHHVSWLCCHCLIIFTHLIIVIMCCCVIVVPCPPHCNIVLCPCHDIVPCHCPCLGHAVIVPCCWSIIVLWVSKVGWEEQRGVLTVVPQQQQQMTNLGHCSSFGCHVTDGNMAPGFCIRDAV